MVYWIPVTSWFSMVIPLVESVEDPLVVSNDKTHTVVPPSYIILFVNHSKCIYIL